MAVVKVENKHYDRSICKVIRFFGLLTFLKTLMQLET